MSSQSPYDARCHDAQCSDVLLEHQRLRDLIRQIQVALRRRTPSVSHISVLIHRLTQSLQTHFEHEERGGYLQDALTAAPQLSALAQRLLEEHAWFLATLDAVHQQIASASTPQSWRTIADVYAGFCNRFDEHEAAENRVLQDALLRDLHAQD
jgi:hemerythrin-like domain-containing protein